LQPTGPLRVQALIHGLVAELKAGHAVQRLVDQLLAAGATREEAAWAVYSAGHGRFAACDNCHTIYESNLVYCSQCGNRLAPFQGRLE
jgi:cytochrome c2